MSNSSFEAQKVNSIASLQRYEAARAKTAQSASAVTIETPAQIAQEKEHEAEVEASTYALRRYAQAKVHASEIE